MYQREGELEGIGEARQGSDVEGSPKGDDTDMDTYPEGKYELYHYEVQVTDKETQTGYLTNDMAMQTAKNMGMQSSTSQTGRFLKKICNEDTNMIPSGQYLNIRAGRKAAENSCLMGNVARIKVDEVGFCNPNDNRIQKAVLRYRMDELMIVSCSFDPATMICHNCPARGKHSVLTGGDGGPVVFVLTDQNFPAIIPSMDKDSCMAIVRVENGQLKDIAWTLIDILSGITVPDKSTVLVGSVSALNTKGVQSYAEDLVWCIRVLQEKIRGNVSVSALVPILVNGVHRTTLVRNIAEIEFWFEGLKGPDGSLMEKTRAILLAEMDSHGRGVVFAPEEQRVTLPDSLHNYNKVSTVLLSWKGIAEQVVPFSQEAETRMVMEMRTELEENFGVYISRNLDLRRGNTMGEPAEYVMIGGSNAIKLATVLTTKGRDVRSLAEKGLKASAEKVEKFEKELAGLDSSVVVIFMVTDNSVYFVEDEDGARRLPQKGADNRYHIDGNLRMASGKQASKILEKFLPLFRLLKKTKN